MYIGGGEGVGKGSNLYEPNAPATPKEEFSIIMITPIKKTINTINASITPKENRINIIITTN
jgi:hypothetical protein